MSILKII